MFSFPLIQGDTATALVNPYSVVMTERMAKKYFGPLGYGFEHCLRNWLFPWTVTILHYSTVSISR